MNSGLGLNITESRKITASSLLIYPLNNVTTPTYTVIHKKKIVKYTLLKIFFSFTDSKTGVIGIDIKFAEALTEDF